MKRFIVFCLVLMLLCANSPFVSYAVGGVDEVVQCQLSEGTGKECVINSSHCEHPNLICITPIDSRCVRLSETTHVREEYFTARCDACLEYQIEIIFSQVVEQHAMQLVDNLCDPQTYSHTYVYRCKGNCEFEDKVVVSCPGSHEIIPISEEEK